MTHTLSIAAFRFLLPVILLLTVGTRYASDSTGQPVTFGVEIGGGLSNMLHSRGGFYENSRDGLVDDDRHLLGNAMAFAILPIDEAYSLQTGIRYVGLGETSTQISSPRDPRDRATETALALHYLSIPLRFRSPVDNPWYGFAGPEFGYLVAANYSRNPGLDYFTRPVLDHLKRFNVAMTVGFGHMFFSRGHRVHIQGMYGLGLMNIQDISEGGNDRRQTQEFAISMGFLLK